MHPDSKEKIVFATPQGLYDFQVMPFGLMESSAVFQWLMQQVLKGLNPAERPGLVFIYVDDILVFSANLEDHIGHLRLVLEQIVQANLKLKPSKCHFIYREIEYLGHVRAANQQEVSASSTGVLLPKDLSRARQYLGMWSFTIGSSPSIAKPLHPLMQKGAEFVWTAQCEVAFLSRPNYYVSLCWSTQT